MKMKRFAKIAATGVLAAMLAVTMTACPGGDPAPGGFVAEEGAHPLDALREVLTHFPDHIRSDLPHVPGSIFEYGLIAASPFVGIIGAAAFWTEANDNVISSLLGTSSGLIQMSPVNQFSNDGVARFEVNVENRSIALIMQEEVFWHDGVPLTMRDLYFTYHVIGHPDYAAAGGIRFSGDNRNIQGIMDFHNGLADSISGLVLSNNDRTLTIYFEDGEFGPGILYFGIWTSPMPEHIFGGTPVLEIPNHPQFRTNVVGWGPFRYVSSVPGESFLFERNPNFVWGTPYIEQIRVRRIETSLVPAALENGEFDVISFPSVYFPYFQNPTNFRYMASAGAAYSYISFRLGTFDGETNRNVVDWGRPMHNIHLRRAMALAADEWMLGQMLFNGLQFPAGNFLTPRHEEFMDLTVPMWGHDPDLANRILDDAGFMRGPDGYRRWPDGSELTVTWAMPINPPTDEPIFLFYTEAWRDIGVRVELWRGQFHAQPYLWDVLDFDTDDWEIDIYIGAWTAGANPAPFGAWGHTRWNVARWTSPEWDDFERRIASDAAWDTEYLKGLLSDIQWYMYDQAFFFPLRWGVALTGVNNRVGSWDQRTGLTPGLLARQFGWQDIRLTAPLPYVR